MKQTEVSVWAYQEETHIEFHFEDDTVADSASGIERMRKTFNETFKGRLIRFLTTEEIRAEYNSNPGVRGLTDEEKKVLIG